MTRRFSRRELLLAGSALALTSCGAAGSAKSGPGQVIVWYESGLAIAPALTSLIDRYNATKPAVPVVAQPQPDLSIKLLVVIGAHDAPNVVIYPRSRAWSLVSRGAGFPLTDFARRDGVTGALFSPGFWQGGMVGNQLWGLPLGGDANVMAYNAKLLSAAKVQPATNWTTSNFDTACAALVKRDNQGHLSQTGAILGTSVPMAIWLWQQGSDVLSADGKTPMFNNAAGLKALTWLLNDQQTNGGAPELGRLVSLTTLTEGPNGVFTHGKAGFLAATYSSFVRLKSQSPGLPIHLMPLPTMDGGKPATMADVIYAFSPQQASAPTPEATWQFIKWLATDPAAQSAMFGSGTLPALLSAQQTPAITGDADAQVMLEALTVARTPQDFLWEPEVEGILDGAAQKALNGQATPQQALSAAAASAQRTIQQAVTLGG